MFGVTSAPEKYQQIIRDVLRGCAGVANIADDLIVHGGDVEEHDKRLFAVLDRLSGVGLTVNGDRCQFRLLKLTFFGHELTSDGINPCEQKIAAIRDARPPKDANDVRSFMGIVQCSSKFMPDVASIAKPIQELTRKGVVFHWGNEQQAAFEELNCLITQAETLACFKVGCRTRIIADASPVGLGAVLTQQQGGMWRVDFELETDHKPLEHIYSSSSRPCARIERLVLRLQGTDNGPQFVYEEFQAFLRTNGMEHRKTTPLWPQANGEVERQNRSLLKCIQIAHLEGRNWRTELLVWLTSYRSTPQTTTGTTPCYMMFGREMRSKLPEQKRETVGVPGEEVQEQDWSSKLKGKAYADLKRGTTPKSISVGDTVLVKAEKTNKLSPNFNPDPFKVVHKTGSEVTLRNETGIELKRNTVFVKK
ncbi:Retrovirus-related Pol polyprotein from transposon 17.6 [Stylophora pistillata]|uniref:Retrovirus-related Pol polyprotein from transposon 17.6 n=1 Tax=Stylophora pistillata TaxID=50429 RepID=A0A2B4S671_STYPI|nr:Retrovirus-related Pol polyprotein from transposon 17.6 [Stylophora pistillata]